MLLHCDTIYGNIKIPDNIADIINTPQFQRLKEIKQLGMLYVAIPAATHSRYDHSIGTYWRAKTMLDCLERNTPHMKHIPSLYRQAVEIAGLLHDIGHGPFSHTWERNVNQNYHHEHNAFSCIDAIFDTLDVSKFTELRSNDNYGIQLIKALIVCEPVLLPKAVPVQYQFIFEIVNNKQCKLDVDKWDYIKRDHSYLKHICNANMDFDSVFMDARVSNNGAHIEYNYKDYQKIYRIFEARWKLHLECYHLPLATACEQILSKIVQSSQPKINGKNVCEITSNDREAFLALTDDNILKLIDSNDYSVYLRDVSKISYFDAISDAMDLPSNGIVATEMIASPGKEMPADDSFYFYGNAGDKKEVEKNHTDFQHIYRFVLS